MNDFGTVISIVAFLLSAATFGYQYFYRIDQITCLITKFGGDVNAAGFRVTLHLAVGNSGTRAILLSHATLSIAAATIDGNRGYRHGLSVSPTVPAVIKSGEFIYLELQQAISIDTLKEYREDVNLAGPGGIRPSSFYTHLKVVTVDGIELESLERLIEIRILPGGGTDARLLKNSPWKLTNRRFIDLDIV